MNGNISQTIRRRRWLDEPLVLFVEGYSDLTFYAEFLEHLGKFDRCFIQDLGGKGRSKLENETLLLLKPDNMERMSAVAVILDADGDAPAAFRLAQAALRNTVNAEVPRVGEWVVSPNGKTRFGIFVVGQQGVGEVETLAWQAWKGVAANRALAQCVDSFIECASKSGCELRSEHKVRIGAALSVLNEDDPRLGPAARARLFDFSSLAFEGIRAFLDAM